MAADCGCETTSVLCTDLEGSTGLRTTVGDAEFDVFLDLHDAVVKQAISRHHGTVVESTGDGFLAWFSSARAALEAAIDVQRDLAGNRTQGWPVQARVRIGLHVGEARHHQRDIFGEAVNAAARITPRQTATRSSCPRP